MKIFNELFDSVFGAESIIDRTEEVSAEKKRLADSRKSNFPIMAVKIGPTAEESRRASETYSEPTRSLQ